MPGRKRAARTRTSPSRSCPCARRCVRNAHASDGVQDQAGEYVVTGLHASPRVCARSGGGGRPHNVASLRVWCDQATRGWCRSDASQTTQRSAHARLPAGFARRLHELLALVPATRWSELHRATLAPLARVLRRWPVGRKHAHARRLPESPGVGGGRVAVARATRPASSGSAPGPRRRGALGGGSRVQRSSVPRTTQDRR